jgi:hypothetical protein
MSLTQPPLLSFVIELNSFTMEHNLGVLNNEYFAPDDSYRFLTFALAIEAATNRSIPIDRFSLIDTGSGDFSVTGGGVPTTSNFTYDTEDGPTTVEVPSYLIQVTIGRSTRARALTYSMFAINWALTLCSMITTSLVFNREREVKDAITLLPITVILAIPTIRSLYVGSPPFGIFLGAR